ncbi:DUF3073 domain-containing protein [Nesterenkonia sp. NBAIMH1]|uniref:DUF3073 domain-containing protein n=1 Tax=Nesterenkonia sp. NBAIMH1 TaxID=2600320 RepID=UPI0011B44AC7|nr:DUF3073 domain-containing protein [Nesterenkonia sp. NBAIMH1]
MGRGRQKAKATKQAREIKYFTPDTDLSALERELAQSRGETEDTGIESDDDPYADEFDADDAGDQR